MRLINIIVRILAIFPTVSMMVACQSPPVPKMGPELATTQKENEKFIIRVTAFAQNALFVQVAGAYYVFESRPKNESDWREIMVFLDDDPVPIREDGIQFVNDHVAYVYMGWLYAVTTDGGHSWKVWDVWNHKQLLSQKSSWL